MSFANSTKVSLDLRGHRLSLEREALMELPESVLLCLFPNGVVLSPQRPPKTSYQATDDDEEDEQEDVYFVDVRPPRRALGSSRDEETPCLPALSPRAV